MNPTGRVNGDAWGVWTKAEGLPVEILPNDGTHYRTARVKLLDDFIVDGRVLHHKGAKLLILSAWVDKDGEA